MINKKTRVESKRIWRYPKSLEREYQRTLRAVVKSLSETTRQHFDQTLYDAEQQVDQASTSERIVQFIQDLYERNGVTLAAITKAKRIAMQLSGHTRQEFMAVLKSALKVDIFAAEPDLSRLLDEWTAENVRLIKSIPSEYFGRLQGIASRGLQEGKMADEIAGEIQDLYAVSNSRAQLIAVDQVGKLNGLISQHRQMTAGIKFYKWSTSLDARVRESHAEREGEYFAWPGTGMEGKPYKGKTIHPPPPGGPPGYPIRCRCVALPVIDTDLIADQAVGAQNMVVDPLEQSYRPPSQYGIIKPKASVKVDELTQCLKERSTGQNINTAYNLAESSELRSYGRKSGWAFDWTKPEKQGFDVYKLALSGDYKAQGLLAVRPQKDMFAAEVGIIESAPHNRGSRGKYAGVGGHLFAIAAKKSLEYGYDGTIFFEAKTALIKHYKKTIGAVQIGSSQRMFVPPEQARQLIKRYFEGGGDGID